MEENNDIENLFREGLQNQELPVRPEIWNNISSSLSGASAVAGAAAKASFLKSIVIGASSVAAIAVVGYSIYASSSEEGKSTPLVTQTQPLEQESNPSEEGHDKTSVAKYVADNLAVDEKNNQEEVAVDEGSSSVVGPVKRSAADVFGTPRGQKNFNRTKSNPNKGEEPIRRDADESAKSTPEKAPKSTQQPQLSVDIYISNKNPEAFEEITLKSTLPEAENSWLLPNGKIHVGSELTYTMEKSGVQKIELLAVLKDGTEQVKTVELSVKAISSLGELPNVLTPNGDGRNDEYTVNVKNVKQFSLTVFDAQGKEVFRSSSVENTWKGLDISGNRLPEGTYRIVVNMVGIDGEKHQSMQAVRLAF